MDCIICLFMYWPRRIRIVSGSRNESRKESHGEVVVEILVNSAPDS